MAPILQIFLGSSLLRFLKRLQNLHPVFRALRCWCPKQTSYRQQQWKVFKHEHILKITICTEVLQNIAEQLIPWEDKDDMGKRAGYKLQTAARINVDDNCQMCFALNNEQLSKLSVCSSQISV